MADIISLTLTIISKNGTVNLNKDNQNTTITINSNTYLMSINTLNFTKKMYSPGEIIADIQFSITSGAWVKISKDSLEKVFKKAEVSLAYSSQTICGGYYVHEIIPRYKEKSMFVTMKMYSPDKLMTLAVDCHSFISMRLGRDIIEGQKNNFKLPYNSNNTVEYDYSNMKQLSTTENYEEAIFPYLVQYNESYWDFLVRTCNRWGEFLYFEGKKLHIGYDEKETLADKDNITTYDTITYNDLNTKPIGETSGSHYSDEATYDDHILSNNLKKDGYDQILAKMYSSPDNGLGIWFANTVGKLLSSGKNLFDFVVDTIVDEGIAYGQAEKKSNEKNADFNKKYFDEYSDSNITKVKKAHYNGTGDEYNEFSAYEPHINAELYAKVLKGELDAANGTITIDFDTTYQDLKLGQVITINGEAQRYIVVQINSKDIIKNILVKDEVMETRKTVYQAVAIAKNETDKCFYPALHPAGHIRTSGPQLAYVTKEGVSDPSRQGRVRVKFPWQTSDKNDITPWLAFAHPGGNNGTGSYYRHYENEQVLVDFVNGNVERPYVVGAMAIKGQELPVSTRMNNIVHTTPYGQSILMTDGSGAGMTAFLAGMSPSLKMIQGFYPSETLFDFEEGKSLQGSVEITDKFGIYSIKGSSDGRNVTINSPYGDVKIGAFTGITVSAPNGDVKIQGKNVTIEAGNNLTLVSGKNVKNKWYTTDYGSSTGANFGIAVAEAVTKKLASLVGGFADISVLRHTIEVFIRPVEGKLQVKSNRYLALEAGKGKTLYPTDAYNKPVRKAKNYFKDIDNDNQRLKTLMIFKKVRDTFKAVNMISDAFCTNYFNYYNACHNAVQGLKQHINDNTKEINNNPTLPCKKWDEIVDWLWSHDTANEQTVKNFLGFTGILKEMNDNEITLEVKKWFFPSHTKKQRKALNNKTAADVKAIQENRRKRIVDQVKLIQSNIARLNILDMRPLIDSNPLIDDDAKQALGAMALPIYFTAKSNQELGRFPSSFNEDYIQRYTRTLRRMYHVILVDDVYKMPREAVGGVNGVGGIVPAAPNVEVGYTEDEWKEYVDSIQEVYKEESKNLLVDVVSQAASDALLGSIGGLTEDFQDWSAFGPNKNGKILFSDGGSTFMLGKEIKDFKVGVLDDPSIVASMSQMTSQKVREFMKA